MNTDYLCETRLRQLNPQYHRLVRNTVQVLFHSLERYKRLFPDYTDHTILHSMQVLDFCNRLMGEYALQLNEDELYVLIMGAYLHDSGMGISLGDYQALHDKVVNPDYRLAHPDENIYETIRAFHQTFSKTLIYKYADLFDIPSPTHVRAIALVSEAHRKSDLYSNEVLPSVLEMPDGHPVHLPYLAALLRLADELDIASDRNIVFGGDFQDTIFKHMHRAIRHLHILPDRFVLDVDTGDPALLDDIRKEFGKLEETLRLCADVVEERTPFRISQTRLEIHRLSPVGQHITVLDTDVGTDDACALLLLKLLPRKPDYIVASYGNATPEGACRNAVILKKYLGLTAKIVQGLPIPEDPTLPIGEKNTFHGPDGLAGCAERMAEKLRLTPEELGEVLSFDVLRGILASAASVTYVTIGTLTNLSSLLSDEALRQKLSGIYVMGGGIREFNCSNETEFNFSKDPESVRRLLENGGNVTLFPLDVTNHQTLSMEEIEALAEIGTFPEYITFLRHNLRANTDFNAIPAAVLHDTLPVLYLSHPEWFTLEDLRLASDAHGHISVSPQGHAVHVCTGVQEGMLRRVMTAAFEGREIE